MSSTEGFRRVALAIFDRFEAGESVSSLAEDYGISEYAVELIVAAWCD